MRHSQVRYCLNFIPFFHYYRRKNDFKSGVPAAFRQAGQHKTGGEKWQSLKGTGGHQMNLFSCIFDKQGFYELILRVIRKRQESTAT